MNNLAALKREAGHAIGVSIVSSPMEAREKPILQCQVSHGALFDIFENVLHEHGYSNLFDLIVKSTDLEVATCCIDLLTRDLSFYRPPLNGAGLPCTWREATANFLVWVMGSTKTSYSAWRAQECKLNPAFHDLSPAQRLALYVVSRRNEMRGLPPCIWSKDYFMGYLYKAAEGGNRSLSGNAVEAALRKAFTEIAASPEYSFNVSACEQGVERSDGVVSRIDIRLTNGKSTIHVHCKSTQKLCNGYGYLYSRDLAGTALDLFEPSTLNVGCFFGPGWEKPTETLDMPKLIAPDFFSLSKVNQITWAKEQILKMGILDVFLAGDADLVKEPFLKAAA